MATNDLQRLQRLREYLQQGGPLAVTPLDVIDMLHEYINMVREPVPQLIKPGEELLNYKQYRLAERELDDASQPPLSMLTPQQEEEIRRLENQTRLQQIIQAHLNRGLSPEKTWETILQNGYATENELREAYMQMGLGDVVLKKQQRPAQKTSRASSTGDGAAQVFYALTHPTEATGGAVSFTPKVPDIRVAASKLLDEIRTAKSLSDAFSRLVSPVREAISNLGRTLLNPFSRP